MTRLLFWGDAADTGFGTVTLNLGRRLIEQGVDVRFLSQNMHFAPLPEPFASRTWNIAAANGMELLRLLERGWRDGWKADVQLVVGDFAAVENTVFGIHPAVTDAFKRTPSLHYIPIEGVGIPPGWGALWQVCTPVAMSNFGADQIATVTGVRPPVVYHGVDTNDFYPVNQIRPGFRGDELIRSKADAKRSFGFPTDRLMLLRTDRHMPRKQYNRLILALPEVFAAVPELDFVIHCAPRDQGGRLKFIVDKLPPEFRGRVFFTNQHNTWAGLPRAELNVLYNAADIYVSTSAEGFGLTVAEAVACGVPVVGMDYSAVPEVIGPAGITVPYAHLVDNEYDHYWAAVDTAKLQEALIRLASRPAQRRQLGALGPVHVKRMFDWDEKARQFAELIDGAVKPEEEAAA